MLKKDALRSALSRILSCKGVKNVEDLMALDTFTGMYSLTNCLLLLVFGTRHCWGLSTSLFFSCIRFWYMMCPSDDRKATIFIPQPSWGYVMIEIICWVETFISTCGKIPYHLNETCSGICVLWGSWFFIFWILYSFLYRILKASLCSC